MSPAEVVGPGADDEQRLARAALTRLAEPATPGLVRAVDQLGARAVLAAIRGEQGAPTLPTGLLEQLRRHQPEHSPDQDLELAARVKARLVCPEDEDWPEGLSALGDREPLALWVRGDLPIRSVLSRSVAVVGARAATTYGSHVASELAYGLACRGWAVVSGGAYGIDALAHRGAMAGGGVTVAVLACGVDVAYPRAHDRLFDRIAEEGLLVSEWPPGMSPRPHRFLVRNRVIAAVTAGTVVVEAAVRSGAMSTGRQAAKLGLPLMAVPGPVTSAMSAGCHVLLREDNARCVTAAAEVVEEVGRIGDDLTDRPQGEQRSRDLLPPVLRGVLEAVPSLRPLGPAVLASRAGVDIVTLRRSVGELLTSGLIELAGEGYRLSGAERAAVRARRAALTQATSAEGPPELAFAAELGRAGEFGDDRPAPDADVELDDGFDPDSDVDPEDGLDPGAEAWPSLIPPGGERPVDRSAPGHADAPERSLGT